MSWVAAPPDPLPPDVDRHYVIEIVSWTGSSLATLFVLARLFTRVYLLRAGDWLDAVLAFAASLGITASSLQVVASRYGAGRHIWYLTQHQIEQSSLFGTVAVPFAQMAMALPKITTAALLVRIAGPVAGRKTRIWLYGVTATQAVLSAVYCIVVFVQCQPVFALWTMPSNHSDSGRENWHCWPRDIVMAIGITVCVLGVFVDFNLALYPVWLISRLQQMPLRRKIAISTIMSLGALATICAGFRIARVRDQFSSDVTFAIVGLTSWTLAEVNLIIITSCIPFLRPLILWLSGRSLDRSIIGHQAAVGEQEAANDSEGRAKRLNDEEAQRKRRNKKGTITAILEQDDFDDDYESENDNSKHADSSSEESFREISTPSLHDCPPMTESDHGEVRSLRITSSPEDRYLFVLDQRGERQEG